MNRLPLRSPCLLLACAALAACAPQETATVSLPERLPTAALFDCADASVQHLHRGDEQWVTRVTRRDVVGGRFETGDFAESNVMGYRVRLVRRDAEPRTTVSVRAAGPYFMDLGAGRALSTFQGALTTCVARQPHSP